MVDYSFVGVQINKIQSINPAISISGLNRLTPTTAPSTTTTGLTTVVVTGSTGATAYVSQPVNTSRIFKNCPSVIGYQQNAQSTAQLSASSILADNKKQQLQHQQHSFLVPQQQQAQGTSSAAGNVIVVHRGWLFDLILSDSFTLC